MKIAIQGHLTRGKEVIQILENLGGKNKYRLFGNSKDSYYIIDIYNDIEDLLKEKITNDYKLYTLEEFEKEFPFKVGDKVIIVGLPDFPKTITKIIWDQDEILYSFENLNNTWFYANALKNLK